MIINILISALMILVGILSAAVCYNTFLYSYQSVKSGEWENALILAFFGLLILLGAIAIAFYSFASPAPIKP